ncbi:MAG: hypothetical protein FD167_4262 [bacterium]|nr:MAG: hypothetical protein FD167_4262 [bacterium]
MTSDEKIQLLLDKFQSFEKRLDEVVTEVKEMRSDLNRLEAKVDTNHKELTGKIDANHAEMIERVVNQRLDIMVINGKIDRSIADQKLHRRFNQAAIAELQAGQEQLENEVAEIKDRLDKAS